MEGEPPAKRLRRESSEEVPNNGPEAEDCGIPHKQNAKSTRILADCSQQREQMQKEIRSRITAYVNQDSPGFSGILKKRYADFMVNEVLPDGQVLHLKTLDAPRRKQIWDSASTPNDEATEKTSQASLDRNEVDEEKGVASIDPKAPQDFKLADEDRVTLDEIFGAQSVPNILSLHRQVLKQPDKKPRDFASVLSPSISSKELRTRGHQAIRRIFSSRLSTQTCEDGTISITAVPRRTNPVGGSIGKSHDPNMRGRLGWDELGGQYCHFNLYKENKDTMEAIFFLASQLKVDVKRFQFGGTKDRRAVTVQRVSVYRVHADQLAHVGKRLKSSRIGDFEYSQKACELGDTGGNEFLICLRDCHFAGEDGPSFNAKIDLAKRVVSECVAKFKESGFINYFGLQRFGSFSTSTDGIGRKMLQGDLGAAIDGILEYSPHALTAAEGRETTLLISSDDKKRAEAIQIWHTTKNKGRALSILPQKFSGESNIIRFLGWEDRKTGRRPRENDFQGALRTIPRNLRLMYVHAYQSLVWNAAAGERWDRYGSRVSEGDLIIINPQSSESATKRDQVDEQGEIVVQPAEDDSSTSLEEMFTRARPLSAAEAGSGRFSIFDIVLPLPGFDVVYPSNETGKFYEKFMGSEEGGHLDPHNMRRSWRDISLSGGYRHLMARSGPGMSFEVRSYVDDDEHLLETDLQRLEKQAMASRGQAPVVIEKEKNELPEDDAENKIAVTLQFRLGSGQYATMALRELMGAGGVVAYKPDYGGR